MMAPDKVGHFKAGLGLAAVPAFILPFLIAPGWAALAGFALATLAGLAKELLDRIGFGTPDRWDAIATIAGGVTGAGLGIAIYGGLAWL